ncbi:hypothetical protein BJ165DRAFT_1590627 [Panaeolus papilionaceus]|nr:hypothetical protein BJ165DRAFT_1590627 [Panaeolus papilionaceus]
MSSRINPLHTPVSDNCLSTYSSLLPAHSDHSVSPGRQLGLRIPVIPYPRHSSRSPVVEPHHVIYFDDATRTSRQGFSMAALATLPLSEHVLADAGVERILLRIIWPGLETIEWSRFVYTRSSSGSMITRAELAVQVSRSYQEFVEANQFDDTTRLDFKLGSGGIQFEHLILVSLRNTFEDTWQAEIAVGRL